MRTPNARSRPTPRGSAPDTGDGAGRGTTRSLSRARAAAVVLAGGLLALSCTGGDGTEDGRSPFTGESAEAGPVLAVKIDNAPQARPHTGLGDADIVYASQVEGGLSRLMAVYSGTLPENAGPVRSARESDLQLLRTFGDPALAFSGARSGVLPLIEESPVQPVTPLDSVDAYFRADDRSAPHNLFVRPEAALAAAPEASDAEDIGFRFGDAPAGGRETGSETVGFPSASFTFTWSQEREEWLIAMDGDPAADSGGGQLGAATVVVQRVNITDSQFEGTPFTETVGSGDATVLRDGRAYDVEWSRDGEDDGTEFTDGDGERVNFATGPVWVVLAPTSS
ncbi:DUF3048 domain-containing protein [Streptomyces otsuchiensis]|uniref:DUF3048 domain-containing protein n=1 Tax=Streptomyces otsuchiensis TaxID=2681388 RepID=UPI00102F4A13|nr:DUF3048 domain-containing protein [Streptomyces otsuchiensis]